MSSNISRYFERSAGVLRNGIAKMIMMQGTDTPSRAPRTLFRFHSQEDINAFATGCDADIGGNSSVHLQLETSPEYNRGLQELRDVAEKRRALNADDRFVPGQEGPESKDAPLASARFFGDMRLDVRPGYEKRIRGGYAGFRNKVRPTIFGALNEDLSKHSHIALRLRLAGDARTHNSYYVNIQTDGDAVDLWQHRLFFKNEGVDEESEKITAVEPAWEDVFIPFHNFVRTNAGVPSDGETRARMDSYREKVKSIGISILGGNSGVTGKYELGIESIRAVNEEDVTTPSPTSSKVDQVD